MLVTVAETTLFMRQAETVWSEDERQAFVNFIAGNPEAGDVIPANGRRAEGTLDARWVGQARRRAGDLFLP